MSSPTEMDYARLAAYIDGEGCISIVKRFRPKQGNRNPHHFLEVSVTNTDIRLVNWCKEVFDGGVLKVRASANRRQKTRYDWKVQNIRAENIIRLCYPYFVIKREQADIAFAFRKTFTRKLGEEKIFPPRLLEPSILAERERLKEELTKSKHIGVEFN